MTGVTAALAVEWRKARRSAVPAVTAGVFGFAAGVAALFMFIAAHPDTAKALGLVGQKAQLAGLAADWPGLGGFAAQVMAVGGTMVFAFCGAWVFGREFADGTARCCSPCRSPAGGWSRPSCGSCSSGARSSPSGSSR